MDRRNGIPMRSVDMRKQFIQISGDIKATKKKGRKEVDKKDVEPKA